jgi:large subunit ribosomal protein L13
VLEGQFPERVLEAAVKRMLPKESPLARKQFSKLRVYASGEHPHEAQSPEVIDFKSMNIKNARS